MSECEPEEWWRKSQGVKEKLKEAVNKNDTTEVERIIQDSVKWGHDWIELCEVALKNRCLPVVKLLLPSDRISNSFLDVKSSIQLIKAAIKSDFIEGVKYLQSNGIPLHFEHSMTKYNWSPLTQCVRNNSVGVLKYLLELRYLNKNPDKKKTLIMLCCHELNIECLEVLLKTELVKTINQQSVNCKCSALHICIGEIHYVGGKKQRKLHNVGRRKPGRVLGCVKLLVEAGADVNLQDFDKETPIQLAAGQGMATTVIYLAERGANLDLENKEGNLLNRLAWSDQISDSYDECIQLLVTKGMDINKPNPLNETPLYLAISKRNEDMVISLINSHCDVSLQDINGTMPIQMAAERGMVKTVMCLAERGATLEFENNQGTLLHSLADSKIRADSYDECVQLLVTKGMDINKLDSSNKTPLSLAACQGNEEMVKSLINSHCDVNIKVGENKESVLMEPIRNYQTTIAEILIQAGCDVHIPDKNGVTPLMECIKADNLVLVKQLIDKGASVNGQDNEGTFVLDYLCCSYSLQYSADIVKMMKDAGADMKSYTLLCRAIHREHCELASLLIEDGIGVNTVNENEDSPLALASEKGQSELVKLLTIKDCDINHQNLRGETALHKAIKDSRYYPYCEDKKEIIKMLLLQTGINVNLTDVDGQTALSMAVSNGERSSTEDLLKAGANVNHCNNTGQTPLMMAVNNKDTVMANILLESGADLKPRDQFGRNAIYLAALFNVSLDLDVLLKYSNLRNEAKSIVNATDKDGKTPFMVAAEHGFKDVVEKLLTAGCNINLQNHGGKTALMFAVDNQDETILSLLLQNGADYNICDNNGQAAFITAAEKRNKSILECLLNAGADVNQSNNHGTTALMAAAGNWNRPILECLLNAGADVNKTDTDGRSAIHYIMVGSRGSGRKWINCLKLLLINKCHVSLDTPGEDGKTLFQWLLGKNKEDLIWYLLTENCSLKGLDLPKVKEFQVPDILKLSEILFESGAPKSEIEVIILSLYTSDPLLEESDNKQKLEDFRDFCKSRSLKLRCRRKIRNCIGPGISSKIKQTGLPKSLQDYVVMTKLIPEKYFSIVVHDKDDDEATHNLLYDGDDSDDSRD